MGNPYDLAWIAILCCLAVSEANTSPADDEYAVLNAFVDSYVVNPLVAKKLIAGDDPDGLTVLPYTVEERHTKLNDILYSLRMVHPGDHRTLCGSYLANNRQASTLDRTKLRCEAGRGIPPQEDINRLTEQGKRRIDRDAILQTYPNARKVLQVSRPGFTPDRRTALIYASLVDAKHPGSGWLSMFLLQKKNSAWSVTKSFGGLVE